MRTFIITGFFAFGLAACGDDSSGDSTSGSSTGSPATSSSSGTPGTEESGTTAVAESGSTAADTTSADTTADSGTTEAAESTGVVDFEMTSPTFEPDGLFPTTMHVSGGNQHPQLDWVGAPADTMSFGVFFHDETISFNHSAIWNISSDLTGLPLDVEQTAMPSDVPGAVQCESWINQFGYGGPGSESNFYVFTLYALDTDDLSGEIDENSSLGAVRSALEDHAIDQVTLRGQSQGAG